ncbi:flagellar M-ring protein FliF, partial [candidate division KSB1 bacterium]
MWENIKGIFAGLKKFYQELEPQKRRVILVSVTVGVMVIVGLLYLINRTSYSVLYSGLDPQDAGVIVEKLKADKVSYRLGNGGTTILVPSGKVYDLRLELANQGIPQIGSVGYEIFDKNNLGTTDFVQRINYRRALEGELARTIAT